MSLIARRPPPPQDGQRIDLHASRFQRSADALRRWAEVAKRCVDYFEGRQWSAADLAILKAEGRPALTLNKIKPLVNLALGYHLNNRTDLAFLPGYDGTGTAEIAAALTHTAKQISEKNQKPYVDSEVFLDGIVSGRGFWDYRLDFSANMLGEVKIRAQDPFSTYVDPDAMEYDLNSGNFVMTSRMVSLEEVEHFYGAAVSNMVGPLLRAGGVSRGMPVSTLPFEEEITPWRRFGGEWDDPTSWGNGLYTYNDFVDAARKTVRLLDIQHYVLTKRWFFVDLDTGSQRAIPDFWDRVKIQKALTWARDQGQPVVAMERAVRRVRWTHMIGDVIAYDDWSPYDTFTVIPFFPYWRRGFTQGMVQDLLDPQDELNKRASAELNIIGRSSNGGWLVHKGSLTPQERENLERHGSRPGVIVEWDSKEGRVSKPEQIQPSATPVAMDRLQKKADDNLKQIAGINDSALGQVDQSAMSGRAIEARQRQTIVGLEGFVSNFHRSADLCGRKTKELIQGHYTEERVIRVIGPGRNPIQMVINQRTAAGVTNDVTLGDYAIAIDETPLAKSFLEGQWRELLEMKGLGMPIPDDWVIDASSVARKEELKVAMAQARQVQAVQGAAAPGAEGGEPGAKGPGPGGSKVGADGGSLPSGPEPGAPPA